MRVPVICVRANVRQVAPHLQILQAEHLTPMYCCIPSGLLLGIGGACDRLIGRVLSQLALEAEVLRRVRL